MAPQAPAAAPAGGTGKPGRARVRPPAGLARDRRQLERRRRAILYGRSWRDRFFVSNVNGKATDVDNNG
jgi:hypothetical protein